VPVTCEAGKQGEGVVASAASRPGSVDAAVATLFAQLRPLLILWGGEQRVEGSLAAHDSFDGILTEHALALEEARDVLSEGLATGDFDPVHRALAIVAEQITYVRALGSVAEKQEQSDG
jgi:hypothetical protein